MYLLEFFSFENISDDAPRNQDSRLQITAARTSKHKPLQLPKQCTAEGVSQNQQWAVCEAVWLLGHILLKDTVADVYCTNSPINISEIVAISLERNKFCAWICVNGQKSASMCLTN